MAESKRRARRAVNPGAETLGGRMLLSHSAFPGPAGKPAPAPTDFQYQLSSHYAWPQKGEVDFTVTRSAASASGPLLFTVQTFATYDEPRSKSRGPQPYPRQVVGPVSSVTTAGSGGGSTEPIVSRVIRTAGKNPSLLPIVPVAGSYKFAPGQTSLTIPIRPNPKFVPAGTISVLVSAFEGKTWIGWGGPIPKEFQIVPSADKVPPDIVSSSQSAQGIALTFSKAMDPATVQNINNYIVTSSTTGALNQPVTLRSAVYDPARLTVTLTPTTPLSPNLLYTLRFPISPSPSGQPASVNSGDPTPLTDLQGNHLISWGIPVGQKAF
jgi:hypothetical protein